MSFLGIFLQILSILLFIADTLGCAALIIVDEITANDPELIVIVAIMWLLGLFLSLWVLGSGIALRQIAKLKKRVTLLEERTFALSYGAPITPATSYRSMSATPFHPTPGAPIQPTHAAPIQPTPVQSTSVVSEQSVSTEPTVPAEELEQSVPIQTPVSPISDVPEKTPLNALFKKKWIFFAIGGAAAVLLLVIILIIAATKNPTDSSVEMPPMGTSQNETEGNMGSQEEQQVEASVENTLSIQMGESIDHKDFSMFFHDLDIFDEYSYDTSDYSSTSLYVEPGYKLLVFTGHFTNLGTSSISESSFSRTMLINGEVLIDGYDVRMNFLRSNSYEIDPYTDLEFVVYANLPEKLASQFETATLTIGFNEDLSIPTTVWDMNGNSTVEVDTSYSLISGLEDNAAALEEMEDAAIEAAPDSNTSISLGETIFTNNYEFTLKNVEVCYEVLPPNTSSVYSSYVTESGKVFVHVEADIKNIMQRDIRIDELYTASALYDGAYPYDGFTVVNDDNRFDWVGSYVAATPLETVGTHSIIECPIEVDESGKSIVVTIYIDGVPYDFILR